MSESFDDVMREMRDKVASDYWVRMADRLQKAHEHEIEHLRKARFHEGYVAGQKSMDAEHRAVAMRLRALPLDEDSHGNLNQIARAIWHSDFGWTQGACAKLRDKIIELLGGVHGDDGGEGFRRCGACGDCDCGGDEQSQVVAYDQSHESSPVRPENETGITDELRECVRTADRQYDDTLWYEMGDDSEADHAICLITEGELLRIADSIDEWHKRLCWQQEAVLQQTIDEMVDEREELRKSLREIADRAGVPHDEDLDRYSDNLVAKATLAKIDSMHEYVGALEWQRDRQKKLLDEHDQTRDELQAKLDKLEKFDQGTSLAAFGDDNDELRKLLSRAAKLLDNAEKDRDANYANWMDCKAKVVQANTTIDELQEKLEEADAAIANYKEREKSFDESERLRDELRTELDDTRKALNRAAGRWAKEREERRELQEKLDAVREALDG